MSKTAIRRHYTRQLITKYKNLQKHGYYIDNAYLSFGRIFSKDPFDCSNTNCFIFRKNITKPRNNNIKITTDLDYL